MNSSLVASVELVPHPRARHFILRVVPGGKVRLTVPRWGSRRAALHFLQRHEDWVRRQLEERRRRGAATRWRAGTQIWFRGERRVLEGGRLEEEIRLGTFRIPLGEEDTRTAVENFLKALARKELPARVAELAERVGCRPKRVVVRDQRTRWGSYSAAGTLSLNWRLVQAPWQVRDYIIYHELMHAREWNHSKRFWKLVESVCPRYREHEAWLRLHGRDLW